MTMSNKDSPVNPYFYGGPIKDPHGFFGREEQLRTIFERLQNAQSTSLIGQRCSGKTSLLYSLMTDGARSTYTFNARDSVFIYMDSQLGVRNPQEFYRELLGTLAEQIPSVAPDTDGDIIQRVVQAVLKKLAPRRLILLLDEFEDVLSAGSFPVEFFRFLRGLVRYDVSFITATMDTLDNCAPPEMVSSPFPNIFAKVYLGSFTESEFDYLIAETSKRSGAPILAHKSEIYKLAGRFPFYVQMACSFYFDIWRERQEITSQDRLSIKHRFADEVSPHFERMWKRYLNLREKPSLVALVHGKELSDSVALRSLTQKGYVVDGHIFSSALTDFILRKEAEGETLPELRVAPRGPVARGIWVDREAGDVWVDGKRIPPLTKLEYSLLLCLYDNANRICDKYDIVDAVWSGRYIDRVDDSRIAKLVSRLRQRVEPDMANCRYIVTVHGRGYKLVAENT